MDELLKGEAPITPLTRENAERLAESKEWLRLGAQTTLSAEAAQALAKHEGGRLFLEGLTQLSDGAAEALAKHHGILNLAGLTTLSDRAAEYLAQHNGSVCLSGLQTLSDEAAEALANFKGGSLHLDGLKMLSNKSATLFRSNPEIKLPPRFR